MQTKVVVETARGVEMGTVVMTNRNVDDDKLTIPVKKIMRIASEDDKFQDKQNKDYEKDAIIICAEKVIKHGLEMKLVDVELTFDRTKIIFYFTADGRVDFRELVKELAAIFRMRIELRQIGVRDEVKMRNGIGICGRPLCCANFLGEFQPVSIKMAKEQNLSLNPTKISGICGRLMCCLKYEEETYEFLNKGLMGIGDIVKTPDGTGEVLAVNVLRQILKVAIRKRPQDAPVINYFPVSDVELIKKNVQTNLEED